jgi:hypothetical protein
MPYQVIFTDAAGRSLRELPSHIQKRVNRWIDLIAEEPRRTGTRQLVGHPDTDGLMPARITSSQHRVIIIVLRIENRRDVYRRM